MCPQGWANHGERALGATDRSWHSWLESFPASMPLDSTTAGSVWSLGTRRRSLRPVVGAGSTLRQPPCKPRWTGRGARSALSGTRRAPLPLPWLPVGGPVQGHLRQSSRQATLPHSGRCRPLRPDDHAGWLTGTRRHRTADSPLRIKWSTKVHPGQFAVGSICFMTTDRTGHA
jgi:hypothetical protein